MTTELAELRSLLEEAAKVLEPFAEAARDTDERGGMDDFTCPPEYSICSASDADVTVGQCRAARALKAKIEERLKQ